MFTSRSSESRSAHWVKCTFRELRSAPGLLEKNYWYATGGHKQYLFQQYDFPFNVYKSVANINSKKALLMDQDRGKP